MMIEKLKQLVQEWEVNEQYLGGPNESTPDRYAAMSYGDCAKKLMAVITTYEKDTNGTTFRDHCKKCAEAVKKMPKYKQDCMRRM
jgi:hypothetical protein